MMSIQVPTSLHEHTPLMPDGSTFRIVSILPGTHQQRIECDFLEIPISAKPDYSALSYAWGSSDVTTFVWRRNHVIGINEALEQALRRLRDQVRVRHFWIDALCINQHDEAGEKTIQVPLMRRIYQQSTNVIIHLGGSQHGTDKIPSLCERIINAYDRSRMDVQNLSYTTHEINADEYHDFGLPETESASWQIVNQFLRRPWFTRVWIIQEAVLSTSVEVICGLWSLEWSYLLRAMMNAFSLGLPVFLDQMRAGTSLSGPTNPVTSATQLFFIHALGASKTDTFSWKYIDLLHRGRISTASRSHDYCYGLLGLSKDFDDPSLRVDYTLPVETVYCQFARYFVEHGDGIKLLYNASGHDLNLPSWVPDWSYRHLTIPRIVPMPQTEADLNPSCAAASSFSSFIRLHPSSPEVLIVRGIVFDCIEDLGVLHSLGQAAEQSRDRSALREHKQRSNGLSTMAATDFKVHGDGNGIRPSILLIADCITELCELLDKGRRHPYPSAEDYETVTWKTLICNFAKGSMRKAPSTYAECYMAFLLLIIAHDRSWRLPHTLNLIPSIVAERAMRDGASNVVTKGNVIIQAATQLCHTKRRGRTRRGYIGQFPLNARVGDLIFLPLGSAVPFLVRSRPSEAYELIGESYVHGIMEGEAFGVAGVSVDDVHLA